MTILIGSNVTTNHTVATNVNTSAGSSFYGVQFTATESGFIESLAFWYNSSYAGATSIKIVVTDAAGIVLGVTAALSTPPSPGGKWIIGSIPAAAAVSGDIYYIGVYASGGNGRCGWMAHSSESGSSRVDASSGTYDAPPAVLSSLAGQSINNGLFYAESITDVVIDSVPSALARGETGLVITGSNFEAVQDTGLALLGDQLLVIESWSDNSITATCPEGVNLLYGDGIHVITVISSLGTSDTSAAIDFTPAPGNQYVGLAGPLATNEGFLLFGYPGTAITNDQIETQAATLPDLLPVEVKPTSAWKLVAPTAEQTLMCWHIDAATGVRSASWVATWDVISGISVNVAYKIKAQAEAASSYKIKAQALVDAGYKIKSQVEIPSAYKIKARALVDAGYKIKSQVEIPLAYKIKAQASVDTGWFLNGVITAPIVEMIIFATKRKVVFGAKNNCH